MSLSGLCVCVCEREREREREIIVETFEARGVCKFGTGSGMGDAMIFFSASQFKNHTRRV